MAEPWCVCNKTKETCLCGQGLCAGRGILQGRVSVPVMLLRVETAPESSSAGSPEVGLVLTYPDSTWGSNLSLWNSCPFQFPAALGPRVLSAHFTSTLLLLPAQSVCLSFQLCDPVK